MNPHIINTDSIHENAFYLLTICASAKNIARKFDLSDENKNFVNNYRGYLPSKVSQILIDTAIKVRLIQDIVNRLEDESAQVKAAEKELNRIYNMGFSVSRNQEITLRFACNKIIHATEIHLIKENGDDEHDLVYCAREDGKEIEVEWEYFDGRVDLSGKYQEDEWHLELQVEEFLEAVVDYVTEFETSIDLYDLYKYA